MSPVAPIERYAEVGLDLVLWDAVGDGKGPREEDWPRKTYRLTDYRPGQQVGAKTGTQIQPGMYLHDTDIDWAKILPYVDRFLPPTDFVFGRPGKPQAHRFYTIGQPLPWMQFEYDGQTFLELRGTKTDGTIGLPTVLPPSIWRDKTTGYSEYRHMDNDGPIAHVERERIVTAVRYLGTVAVIAYVWPENGRHDLRLAFARVLLDTLKIDVDAAILILQTACEIGGSDQDGIAIARRAVLDTKDRLDKGGKAKGIPSIKKHLPDGEKIVDLLCEWYGITEMGTGRSHPTKLVNLALETRGLDLFINQEKRPHATVPIGGTRVTMAIDNPEMKEWLGHQFYASTKGTVSGSATKDAIATLKGRTSFAAPAAT
jgi:hypothetical protein